MLLVTSDYQKDAEGDGTAMKRTLGLVVLLGLVSSPVAAQGWFKGTYGDALREAASSRRLVLIDFASPG